MNILLRMIIAIALGLGVSLFLRWLASLMGYTEAQINGAGGIGIIIAGLITIMGFWQITERRNHETD